MLAKSMRRGSHLLLPPRCWRASSSTMAALAGASGGKKGRISLLYSRHVNRPRWLFLVTEGRHQCMATLATRATRALGLGSTVLDEERNQIVRDERALLERLYDLLYQMDADKTDLDILRDAISQLEDLFMVVVCGEFNAGKSRFINALLGERFQKEGVTPTTAKIAFIKHENRRLQPTKYADADGRMIDEVEDRYINADLLTNLALVDTPGTNAVIQRHSQLAHRIVPRADIVIFLTSVGRPFADSERQFLQEIAQWHKKVVLVLNQIDLRTPEELAEIEEYVKSNARAVLGVDLRLFPISAKLALEAKLSAKPHPPELGPGATAWKESRFGELQDYLSGILTDENKVTSKLQTPLGVAEKLSEGAKKDLARRQAMLVSDLSTLRLINEQMDAFMRDLQRDVKASRLQIDKILNDMVERGETFLADNASLWNVRDLLDSKRFTERFKQQVVGTLGTVIDEIIAEMSGLVADRARTQSRAVLDFLGRRPGERYQHMVGHVTEPRFDGMRHEVLARLQTDVHDVMKTYDKDKEFAKLSQEIKQSVMTTAAVEAGAATVGALVAAHMVDVTGGLITASSLAILGLVVLPYRRQAQSREFRKRVAELRQQMENALTLRLDRELSKIRERVLECIGPYTRFVGVEENKLKAMTKDVGELEEQIAAVRRRITRED